MSFAPRIAGSVPIRTAALEFLAAFDRRVQAGLLSGRPHPRSNYAITLATPDRIEVRAADWWTAIAVGLNEVVLQAADPRLIRYQVRYWRWATYALGLSAALGAIGLTLLLLFDVRAYVEQNPGRLTFLTPDQNVVFAWSMVLFWGFVWPWVLILLHQRPLRRLIERLIAQVDAGQGT